MKYTILFISFLLGCCQDGFPQQKEQNANKEPYFTLDVMTGGHYQDKINDFPQYKNSQFITKFFPRKICVLYNKGRFKVGGGWAKYYLVTDQKLKINYPFMNYIKNEGKYGDVWDWTRDENDEIFFSIGYSLLKKQRFNLAIYGDGGKRLDGEFILLTRVGLQGAYQINDRLSLALYPAFQHYYFGFVSVYGGLKIHLPIKLYQAPRKPHQAPENSYTAITKPYIYSISLGSAALLNNFEPQLLKGTTLFAYTYLGIPSKLYNIAFLKLRTSFPFVEFSVTTSRLRHNLGIGYRNSAVSTEIGDHGDSSYELLKDVRSHYQLIFPFRKRRYADNSLTYWFLGSGVEFGWKKYFYSLSFRDLDLSPYLYQYDRTSNVMHGLLQYTIGKTGEFNGVCLTAGINLNIAGYITGEYIVRDKIFDFIYQSGGYKKIITGRTDNNTRFTKFIMLFPFHSGEVENLYHLQSVYFKISYVFKGKEEKR